jgi:hypothetical protein
LIVSLIILTPTYTPPGIDRQVRRKDIGADRIEKTAPVKRKETGLSGSLLPSKEFCDTL